LSANEPQTLRDEYSRATKILDAKCKAASLDDVIKTCGNLHVEEQHQLNMLLQKYEYTVVRSEERQLQPCKEIERLIDIGVGVLEEVNSFEWSSVFPIICNS
jgi:hypothetical protein